MTTTAGRIPSHFLNAAGQTVRWHVAAIEHREPIATAPGHFHPNTASCEKCGREIRWVVTLRSTDGETLKTGADCAVTLEGGPELAEIRREMARWAAAAQDEKTRATRARYIAERQARRDAQAARNAVEFATLLSDLDTIAASASCTRRDREFAAGLAACYRAGERAVAPSDIELKIIARARAVALLPVSTPLGTAGDVVTLRVVYERGLVISTGFGPKTLLVFRAAAGEVKTGKGKAATTAQTDGGQVLVWWTTSPAYDCIPDRDACAGAEFELTATVKRHGERDGIIQTEILRAKLTPTTSGWFAHYSAPAMLNTRDTEACATVWARSKDEVMARRPGHVVLGPFATRTDAGNALEADPAFVAAWDASEAQIKLGRGLNI